MVSWEDAVVTSVQQCLKWNQADIVFFVDNHHRDMGGLFIVWTRIHCASLLVI